MANIKHNPSPPPITHLLEVFAKSIVYNPKFYEIKFKPLLNPPNCMASLYYPFTLSNILNSFDPCATPPTQYPFPFPN